MAEDSELGGGCVGFGEGILELVIDLGRELRFGEFVEHELDVFLEEVLAEARWQSVVVREACPVGGGLVSAGAGGGGRRGALEVEGEVAVLEQVGESRV